MKLEPSSIEWAINSLYKRDDTDLFPKLAEFRIASDLLPESRDKIADLDISSSLPAASRRFIVPKGELSYRAATQLDPLDSIIFTALIYQFGQLIEDKRRPIHESTVFSYRFDPSDDGELYQSHGAWNAFWSHCLEMSREHNFALLVDVSDFYNQVYHHTIENRLIDSGLPNQATNWIKRLLESVTSKVSRGIPIGPHPAHLLAEASFIPIDNSLLARGITFCRFVDDIVIFADDELSLRTSVYQVAEILDKQQRLQLQNSKTRILDASSLQNYCRYMIEDRPINDVEEHLLGVVQKYSKGDPYRSVFISELLESELEAFNADAVEKILNEYLAKEEPDFVRLRWFLRRLSQVRHDEAVEFLLKNFDEMVPAVSEICRYFVSASESKADRNWPEVGEQLLSLLDKDLIQSNEYFQISILALFSNEPRLDHMSRLISKYSTSSTFMRREILLAAAESGQIDWLRELKETVPQMEPWAKRAYLYASRQLPTDERKFFLGTIAKNNVLDELIVSWAKK